MAIKLFKQIKEEVDKTFFAHDALWEASRIDGKTKEDLVRVTYDNADFFITTKVDNIDACITACTNLTEGVAEVHTFVLPEYRKVSDEILGSHLLALEALGYKQLYTVCSSRNKSAKRFLEKRLGFETYAEFTCGLIKIDGEMPVVYRLVKIL